MSPHPNQSQNPVNRLKSAPEFAPSLSLIPCMMPEQK